MNAELKAALATIAVLVRLPGLEENPKRCEECGLIAETRPYGLHYEDICIECGLKDVSLSEFRMKQFIVVIP